MLLFPLGLFAANIAVKFYFEGFDKMEVLKLDISKILQFHKAIIISVAIDGFHSDVINSEKSK